MRLGSILSTVDGASLSSVVRRKTTRRALTILIALAVGWIVYMIAMVMTVYDGLLSMIFQPIIAVICSSLTVGMSLLVGLLFKVPVLGRWWRVTPIPVGLLVVASLVILCFGASLGLRQTFTHPETQQPIVGLRPDAALGGYFVLLFAIANWPLKQKWNAEHPRLYCCGAKRSQQLHLWLNKPGVRGDSGGGSLGER
ncbi:MAG: hypothetical protein J0M24_11665 [Verrucomicrobia bacterium]|nr:hypothetical protein [Verrucomicrobiota bacterium]